MTDKLREAAPVAWMYDWDQFEGEVVRDWVSQDYDEAHSPTLGCHNIRPLYTHPAPAQKPLTQDQLREIFLAAGFTVKPGETDLKPYVYAAARAIEAAHGITGETK
jgi:hypothetical protein